jgi:hypothetical protein
LDVNNLLNFEVFGFIVIVTAIFVNSAALQLHKIISPHDAQRALAFSAMPEWTAINGIRDAKSRLMLTSFLPLA